MRHLAGFAAIVLCATLLGSTPSLAQFSQQGPKLVGTGAVGHSNIQPVKSVSVSTDGSTAIVVRSTEVYVWVRSGGQWAQQAKLAEAGVDSASISGDGNTVVVGVGSDDNGTGAAWVWTRTGGGWTQNGAKLVGSGALMGEDPLGFPIGAHQGSAVAISADGNTVIVGGPYDADTTIRKGFPDNRGAGAAWVWARSDGGWTQQGPKLHAPSISNGSKQGSFVSLSSDGDTAIVGGSSFFCCTPAEGAWVWTRNGGVWTPQGELIGSGGVTNNPPSLHGNPVGLSADGNTAIVGAPDDNNAIGAAWIWIRNAGVWTQQGNKLTASNALGPAFQGSSVSISSDGDTVLIGGNGDNGSAGATWAWTRSGGVWTQQGAKLVGSGAAASAKQGNSVVLSGDGNTALVGGNGEAGPVWVWTRSGGIWTQQGSKLIGSGGAGITAYQGVAVALSADGNTAIVGGNNDSSGIGAVWIWTRNAGVWTQQGSKLVGSGANQASQGYSVALSADGNTALVGGPTESTGEISRGAAWVWTRSGGVWTEQAKLVGSDSVGASFQGWSVALSADGNTAIVGGVGDNNYVGAAWVWARSGVAWTQQSAKLVGSGAVTCAGEGCSSGAAQGTAVALSADGNTALVGGSADNPVGNSQTGFITEGAAWVWTRHGGVWTQQGSKIVGSDDFPIRTPTTSSGQGSSVALAGDGNTAVVGANNGLGAAWVWTWNGKQWNEQRKLQSELFQQGRSVSLSYDGTRAVVGGLGWTSIWTRNADVWTEQDRLVGSGAVGDSFQGAAVSVSADGRTLIAGGWLDNYYVGAAWIFVADPPRRRAVRH
jgi:hypothetical protein